MFLDHRLTNTQLVNAVADSLNGLLHRPVLELGQLGRLHSHSVGVLSAGIEVVLGQVGGNDIAQVGTVVRRNPFHHDVVGIICGVRLGNVSKGDVSAAQGSLQALDGLLGVYIDRIIHLHLQDEVGAAFEVQAQGNAVLESLSQALSGKAGGDTENAVHEQQEDGDDEN